MSSLDGGAGPPPRPLKRNGDGSNGVHPKLISTGTGPSASLRQRQRHGNVDFDPRTTRVFDHADDVPLDRWLATGFDLPSLANFPFDLGDVLGDSTVNFAFQHLDDFRSSFFPPLLGGRDVPSVLRLKNLRQLRVGIGLRLVIVRGIWRVRIAVPTGAKLGDAQLIEHVLMILPRREHDRLFVLRCSRRGFAVLRRTKVRGGRCDTQEDRSERRARLMKTSC